MFYFLLIPLKLHLLRRVMLQSSERADNLTAGVGGVTLDTPRRQPPTGTWASALVNHGVLPSVLDPDSAPGVHACDDVWAGTVGQGDEGAALVRGTGQVWEREDLSPSLCFVPN